jgi:hypothetical protein
VGDVGGRRAADLVLAFEGCGHLVDGGGELAELAGCGEVRARRAVGGAAVS